MTARDPRIAPIIEAGQTRRWHTHPLVTQSLADHQWGVAVALLLQFPDCTKEMLAHALLHDIHEKVFGDSPSPAKADPLIRKAERTAEDLFRHRYRLNDLLPPLDEGGEDRLKWADRTEAWAFLRANLDRTEIMDIFGRMADFSERVPE